jgi:hypothetical protein
MGAVFRFTHRADIERVMRRGENPAITPCGRDQRGHQKLKYCGAGGRIVASCRRQIDRGARRKLRFANSPEG